MEAQAHVIVEADGARLRYRTLRSDPPLLLRPTADALYLVGGSAGPLGGDALALHVTVREGAQLTIRSAAATCLLPRNGERSTLEIHVCVEDGATLDWRPEPTISIAGSDHRQRTDIELHGTAQLRWMEHLVLGRWSEPSGQLSSSLRIERDGAALSHQDLEIGDLSPSPTILGAARELETILLVGNLEAGQGASESENEGTTFDLGDDAIMYQRIGRTGDPSVRGVPSTSFPATIGSAREPAR